MINVFLGRQKTAWLFEDLQALFAKAGAVTSEKPLPDASAYICIRTDEASLCPHPERLVIQCHDLWPHAYPGSFYALVRAHPDQFIPSGAKYELCRPLGALASMKPRKRPSGPFTAGWVGRPANLDGRVIRSPQPFVDAMKSLAKEMPCRAILAGDGLLSHVEELQRAGVDTGYFHRSLHFPSSYHEMYAMMDVLCITSVEEAGPMPLFEALACGIPVLSTPVGWAPQMLNGENGWVYNNSLFYELRVLAAKQMPSRKEIAKTMPWRLNGPGGWIDANMSLAEEV